MLIINRCVPYTGDELSIFIPDVVNKSEIFLLKQQVKLFTIRQAHILNNEYIRI